MGVASMDHMPEFFPLPGSALTYDAKVCRLERENKQVRVVSIRGNIPIYNPSSRKVSASLSLALILLERPITASRREDFEFWGEVHSMSQAGKQMCPFGLSSQIGLNLPTKVMY